jgi:hypothetical protein
MFRGQRWSKPLLFHPRILLPEQLQHLPPECLWLRATSRAAVLEPGLLLLDSASTVSSTKQPLSESDAEQWGRDAQLVGAGSLGQPFAYSMTPLTWTVLPMGFTAYSELGNFMTAKTSMPCRLCRNRDRRICLCLPSAWMVTRMWRRVRIDRRCRPDTRGLSRRR